MSEMSESLAKAIHAVTKEFVRAKRAASTRKQDELSPQQLERLRKDLHKEEIKRAAYKFMPQAYLAASDNGRLPANVRQLMYAARPLVLEETGSKCWSDSAYFTQVLLPDYMTDHPEETAAWDIVFDARGHLKEPHIPFSIGLGTLNVRSYIARWTVISSGKLNATPIGLYPTNGPENRYRFALFIEKEGFGPLLEQAGIPERYDLAVFSSKGLSTTATRMLVDALSNAGVTTLVLHDFDIAGLTILHTLRSDTRRYTFTEAPNVLDLGLRLDDVKRMGLATEPVTVWQRKDPREKLEEYGATKKEQDFLVLEDYGNRWKGKRVELNAMTSRQLLDWLEKKLKEHGVKKVLPDAKVIQSAWRRAKQLAAVNRLIEDLEKQPPGRIPIPKNLRDRVAAKLKRAPELSWDRALAELAVPGKEA